MKRGEAYKKIKEVIRKKPGITKGDLEKEFVHSTIWYNIYSDKGKLKKDIRIEIKQNSKGQLEDTYYLTTPDNNLADPNYLKFLMQNYESSTLLRDRLKQIQINVDIYEVCQHKKIRDEEFIKFLIKHSKKKEIWGLDIEGENIYQDGNGFWMCLGTIASKLLRDIEIDKKDNAKKEESLLELIRNVTGEFFEKVIFNPSEKPSDRELALSVLRLMNHPEKHNIAFKLLEKIDTEKKLEYTRHKHKTFVTEFDVFKGEIESLIFSYNKTNPTECRKRLYAILDANLGSVKLYPGSEKKITFADREKKLRKEIIYLLETTREKQYSTIVPLRT